MIPSDSTAFAASPRISAGLRRACAPPERWRHLDFPQPRRCLQIVGDLLFRCRAGAARVCAVDGGNAEGRVTDLVRKPDPQRREPLLSRLRDAFIAQGYEAISMIELARLVGLSRRMLYNHFSNKTEAFRYMLWHDGDAAISNGLAAGQEMVDKKKAPLDIFVRIMDLRYAENRRVLMQSAHALEINDKAFRLARDIQIEHATLFQEKLAALIAQMEERGLMAVKRGTSPGALAQMLCDGARGSNQALPPVAIDKLPERYRQILGAILYGALVPKAAG
jgi:AcrR family transcriptional regulator